MTIKSESLKGAKAALQAMSKKKKTRITKSSFVDELIKEIHSKMENGFTLKDIHEELNNALSGNEKLNLNTFKSYVLSARKKAGLQSPKALKRRRRKEEGRVERPIERDTKVIGSTPIATGFRDQGGDL